MTIAKSGILGSYTLFSGVVHAGCVLDFITQDILT